MNSSSPARMWQGVNKANQEGDVWPVGCSSHKSLHTPELQRTERVPCPATQSPELPAPSHAHTSHPPLSSTLAGFHLSPLHQQTCSRVKYFSFCGKCCSYTMGYCVIQCALGMCVDTALLKAVWKVLLKTLISKVYKWQKYLFLGQNLI